MQLQRLCLVIFGGAFFATQLPASAADWPQWGGRDNRQMVSEETHLPESFAPGTSLGDGSGIDLTTTHNVKWVARIGTYTCGSPIISGGKVFIGSNNGHPRDERFHGDRGTLMCFEEATGKFLWQFTVPKLKHQSNFNGDFEGLGVCASPTVQGKRLWLTTSRCEAVCLDVNGLADGNDGPFTDEGEYLATSPILKTGKQPRGGYPPELPRGPFPPLALQPTDADIIWRFDFMSEIDVWPQDATDCSPLVFGDLVYTGTSNGVDLGHKTLPSPLAPSFIALDKRTGKLVAVDNANMSTNTFHGIWSSPSLAHIGWKNLILFGGGDGVCYAFDPKPVPVPQGGGKILRVVWKCDANPPEYRERDGKKLPYNKNAEGPSEVTGTPVFYKNRVYVTVGQDTRHGVGKGCLTCMDATKTGDISATGVLWRYTGIDRSVATPSIVNGLLFVADYRGTVHCLDADTGKVFWTHETKGENSMSSTYVADGKVYFGNGNGKLTVLAANKEKKLLSEVNLRSAIYSTPVAANGVLYIASQQYLYALEEPKVHHAALEPKASKQEARNKSE